MFLTYALQRSAFKRRFEPKDDGFIYRARATAPAIAITRAEREELLLEFRGEYWRRHLIMLGAAIALIIVLGVLDFLLIPVEATESFVRTGAFIILIPLIVVAYFSNRRLFELPMRRFADRAPVAPRRAWLEVVDTSLRNRSWVNMALSGAIGGAIGWLMFPDAGEAWWPLPVWCAYFGPLSAFWLWTLWRKWQLE